MTDTAAELNQQEVKTEITIEVATLALKDAVENLRTQIVKQHPTPDNKATIEVEAKHYLDIAKKTASLADAVKDAQERLKIIDAKTKLESFDLETKLEVLGLTKEKLLAQLGITLPTGGTDSSSKDEPALITIKYLNKAGEILTKEVENTKQITAKNYPNDPELVEFWDYCKDLKKNKGSVLDDSGKKVYNISKQYLADTSDETMKEQFKPFYTAA